MIFRLYFHQKCIGLQNCWLSSAHWKPAIHKKCILFQFMLCLWFMGPNCSIWANCEKTFSLFCKFESSFLIITQIVLKNNNHFESMHFISIFRNWWKQKVVFYRKMIERRMCSNFCRKYLPIWISIRKRQLSKVKQRFNWKLYLISLIHRRLMIIWCRFWVRNFKRFLLTHGI